MDEDNQEQLKTPQVKTIDMELMEKIKKAEERRQKEKEDKEKEAQDAIEQVEETSSEFHSYKDKPMSEGVKMNEKEEPLEVNPKKEEIEAMKSNYQEMADKVKKEKEDREIRLQEMKSNQEDNKPNPRGSLLKDIGIVIIVVSVIVGAVSLMLGNFIVSMAIIIGSLLLGSICLGLAEIIRLLQLIYDLLYFEKYGRKRK